MLAAALSTPAYFDDKERFALWYGGKPETDELCRKFSPLIAAASSGELGWGVSTEGRMAVVILLDQLSRGAYRGSPQAFEGDAEALATAKAAYASGDELALSIAERSFLLLPLMHSGTFAAQSLHAGRPGGARHAVGHEQLCRSVGSWHNSRVRRALPAESLEDQDACVARTLALAADAPAIPSMAFTVSYAHSHHAVVKRFGHFPHRNEAMGRPTSAEEAAWLASEECPGWAKSQGKK